MLIYVSKKGVPVLSSCGASDKHIDGLMRDLGNSIANALELPKSYAKTYIVCQQTPSLVHLADPESRERPQRVIMEGWRGQNSVTTELHNYGAP